MKNVENEEFKASDDRKKGTHSLKKFAATFASAFRCSKDKTDARARWKGQSQQEDANTDVTVPHADTKVAMPLHKEEPLTCRIKGSSGISKD